MRRPLSQNTHRTIIYAFCLMQFKTSLTTGSYSRGLLEKYLINWISNLCWLICTSVLVLSRDKLHLRRCAKAPQYTVLSLQTHSFPTILIFVLFIRRSLDGCLACWGANCTQHRYRVYICWNLIPPTCLCLHLCSPKLSSCYVACLASSSCYFLREGHSGKTLRKLKKLSLNQKLFTVVSDFVIFKRISI